MKAKRISAFLLCLVMLLSLMPTMASADESADGEFPVSEEVSAGEDTPSEVEEPADEDTPADEAPEDEESEEPSDEEAPAEEEPADEEAPAEEDIDAESEEDLDAQAETSGTCGNDLTWVYNESTATLTISGTGAMTDWEFEQYPLWHSYSIKTLVISSGVTSIGSYAFYCCSSLTSVTIPSSVTSIGSYAFDGCSSLTGISLPASVTGIGDFAFCYSALTSIKIPSSVTSIGEEAFAETALTSITIPSSVTSIGEAAFARCSSLTSVTVSDGVTSTGDETFSECTGLTSVTIPSGVTSIGSSPFGSCTGLTAINVASDNRNYCSVDGVLFNKGKTELLQYPAGKTGTSYTIPSGVTSIGEAAFRDSKNLTSVTISSGVTSIGDFAFYLCSNLASVTIPSGVTIIGMYAFNWCKSLTSVTIPSSVTRIYYEAFGNCRALTEIRFKGNAPEIGYEAFYRVTATAYYPAGNTTWTDDVKQDYLGTITWKAYTPMLDAPVITGVYNYSTYIKVVWNAVPGAESYRVSYRKGTGDWVKVYDTTATRVNVNDLEDGATYTFKVECWSKDGKTQMSAESNRASQIRLLSPLFTVTRFGRTGAVSGSGFTVSWNATTGGSCYKVYYREKGGSWALYANYAKSNNTRYVNIKADQTNASTAAGAKFPDLIVGHTYEFAVLTATSQASITSGFPTNYTGYKF